MKIWWFGECRRVNFFVGLIFGLGLHYFWQLVESGAGQAHGCHARTGFVLCSDFALGGGRCWAGVTHSLC